MTAQHRHGVLAGILSTILAVSLGMPVVAFGEEGSTAPEGVMQGIDDTDMPGTTVPEGDATETPAIDDEQQASTGEPGVSTPDDAVTEEVQVQDEQGNTADDMSVPATDAQVTVQSDPESPIAQCSIKGRAQMQRKGWLDWTDDHEASSVLTLGITGKSLRLEAFRIQLNKGDVSGDITYQAHVQRKGWSKVVKNGGLAGTVGKGLRVEALRASLTGDVATMYDLWYRVHVSGLGWMGWTKNGEDAGTEGFGRRVEAIQVMLSEKDAPAPTQDGNCEAPFAKNDSGVLRYGSYVSNRWQGYRKPDNTSGTTGKKKQIKAIRAVLEPAEGLSGSVRYKAHVSGSGWTESTTSNEPAGNFNAKVEAVTFSLTGDYAKLYDIWYRAHVQSAGWLGWAKNGERAGSVGASKAMEAYQIKLLPKGSDAPGSTDDHCVKKSYFMDTMTRKAQGYDSPTGWLVMVDNTASKVGIYRGSRGHWKRIKDWYASCGKSSTPTIRGVFAISDKGYVFGEGYSCYYWTRFYGDYLFHSIKYNEGTFDVQEGALGYNLSMGCVRLSLANAKWLQENVPRGSTVVSY